MLICNNHWSARHKLCRRLLPFLRCHADVMKQLQQQKPVEGQQLPPADHLSTGSRPRQQRLQPPKTFSERVEQLQEYVQQHGRMPRNSALKGSVKKQLASWVAQQKLARHAGLLDEPKQVQLAQLEGWDWGKTQLSFGEKLQLLRAFQ
jgi:hypothetical protein